MDSSVNHHRFSEKAFFKADFDIKTPATDNQKRVKEERKYRDQ